MFDSTSDILLKHFRPALNLSLDDEKLFIFWARNLFRDLHSSVDSQKSPSTGFLDLFTSIPAAGPSCYLPLACFSVLLDQYNGPLPSLDVLQCWNKLWSALPEETKAGSNEVAVAYTKQLQRQVATKVGDLSKLFPRRRNDPALIDPSTKTILTHQQLSTFIQDFSLPLNFDVARTKTPIVVLALPNGYLLGLACLAVTSHYTAAPINISGGAKQFQSDAELVKPQAILVLESDVDKLGLRSSWIEEAGIDILVLQQNSTSTFDVQLLSSSASTFPSLQAPCNSGDDFALILLTSGTSGKKKVVPVTTFSLINGVSCVIDSWGLGVMDSCVNMMPLNHVGGIVRNLFAPVFSGGSTVLCAAFDPNMFWDIIEEGRGTWYYASPSMHTSILAEGDHRPEAVRQSQLRLICNAAGGLLPALALRLRATFHCTVLPSYGMTECMPISTPPLNYKLERPGTSGISCGPELAILDEETDRLQANQVGRICVRGGPTFGGYLKGETLIESVLKGGWFDTGDLGFLDGSGYLYVTGRGKEVINRGGELISPFEIEEAITIASQTTDCPLFGRVKEVLAFSAPHDVLQEVVGVALVVPPGQTRPDIRELQAALKSSLHSSKWPVVIVYMDGLPTSNNKVVRIKLGERLSFDVLTDDMKLFDRHFEAVCPPINSTLDTKIQRSSCFNDSQILLEKVQENLDPDLEAFVKVQLHDGMSEVFIAPRISCILEPYLPEMREELHKYLREELDGYLIPSKITYIEKPFPKQDNGSVNEEVFARILENLKHSSSDVAASDTEMTIRKAFAEVLGIGIDDISSGARFFDLGGDSMSAGRLLSIIRRELKIRIPVDQLFTFDSVAELTDLSDQLISARDLNTKIKVSNDNLQGLGKTYSSTNPLVLALNLLPITFFYPLRMAFQWTVFTYSFSTLSTYWRNPHIEVRFLNLIAAMTMARVAIQVVAPMFGIFFKWIVIGRYKQGIYPMWGLYHSRWWITDKVLLVCSEGAFASTHFTRLLYYRWLGAKIGKGVTIELGTTLGEFDLLEIGDNAHLDRCICRPFACEQNASMFLGKIVVGKNSSVGLKSYVAAGSILPDDTFIGPNSSSYERDDAVKDPSRGKLPATHILLQVLVIFPLQVIVLFMASLPWMCGLFGIVKNVPNLGSDGIRSVIHWWATPSRILYHYLAQGLHVTVGSVVWFAAVVSIKRLIDIILGKLPLELSSGATQMDIFRRCLMTALVPNGNLTRITKLFGTHYEFTSMAVRALGGTVGKRVYWPGTGPSIQDFDLVNIEDDVVFGSRSHIVTTDSLGSYPVHIKTGAMIADRVVLLPGSTVGDQAVLGSGVLTRRGQYCENDSVWLGSKMGGAICLTHASTSAGVSTRKESVVSSYASSVDKAEKVEQPSAQKMSCSYPTRPSRLGPQIEVIELQPVGRRLEESSPVSTSSPFGKAFYEGKANYFVLGQATIFAYSIFLVISVKIYWNAGTVASVIISNTITDYAVFRATWYRPLLIFGFATMVFSCIVTSLAVLSLIVVIIAKWVLLGRRKPGSYDWDKSSYCQRWQLFLAIEGIRRYCFGGNGVIGMITGSHYAAMYFRALGAKIGKDCALFAGGKPSLLFTEPDLLELGDRVAIDDASLVSHINSRGKFSLNPLRVGSGSVLRSGSRLLSGAQMGEGSCLLEHTLIMAGDIADDQTTYQGWPADVFHGDRLKGTVI